MKSNNPILTRVQTVDWHGTPATMKGTIQRSIGLATAAGVLGLLVFLYSVLTGSTGVAVASALVGAVGSLILGLIVAFKPEQAHRFGYPFAFSEGVFLGGVSYLFHLKFPGIPFQALLATFVTTAVMFTLYKKGIVRATEKFKSIVISASIAIFIVFIVQITMQLIFGSSIPLLFENGPLGLLFAAFVAIIASLNLILDFDLIETSIQNHAPKYMEWVGAIALLSTLVWMYYSFLRLLSLLED